MNALSFLEEGDLFNPAIALVVSAQIGARTLAQRRLFHFKNS